MLTAALTSLFIVIALCVAAVLIDSALGGLCRWRAIQKELTND